MGLIKHHAMKTYGAMDV